MGIYLALDREDSTIGVSEMAQIQSQMVEEAWNGDAAHTSGTNNSFKLLQEHAITANPRRNISQIAVGYHTSFS